MVIRLGQEIDTARVRQASETVQHFGGIFLQLINRDPRYREGNPDVGMLFDQFQEQRIGRQVAIGGDALNDVFIEVIVKIAFVTANIKKAQFPKPAWLVNLKV